MHRTRRSLLTIALAGAAGAALVAGPAAGAVTTLHATMSGSKEVPRAGNGRGSARITLDDSRRRVCYRITLRGVGSAMAGHIHRGGPGTAGPIVVPLFTTPTRRPQGCVSAQRSLIRAIRRHPARYYVNVHTARWPAGAARGQLH
jgi:hypothetical protein